MSSAVERGSALDVDVDVDVGAEQTSNGPAPSNWLDANQRYLSAALAVIKCRLEIKANGASGAGHASSSLADAEHALEQAALALPAPSSLETVRQIFGLSPFESELLLLCAGFELDSELSARFGAPHTLPTFSMALAALPEPHWSALTPGRPLRYFRLLEVQGGGPLVTSPLRIDERVLHHLTGIRGPDARLEGIIEPLEAGDALVPTHERQVEAMLDVWAGSTGPPVVELWGLDAAAKRAIAMAACARLGLQLYAVTASALGRDMDERLLTRLLTREALLDRVAFFLDGDGLEPPDEAHAALHRRLSTHVGAPMVLSTRDRGRAGRRPIVSIEVKRPTLAEQRGLFLQQLRAEASDPDLESDVDRVVSQFDLGVPAIRWASNAARRSAALEGGTSVGQALWDACRAQARAHLEELAQRVDSRVGWADLVVPEPQRRTLQEIGVRMRQRTCVYDTWGFAEKGARGLGLSALFAGPSGTGKTLAAEVLANELRLDLYRVDLSQVVSKYIGETERNLRRVFDAAEAGSAVLLFDEADALFGKRSEVKDSHDRYANIEIGYLLQRMEAYRGLAILTTNFRSALDAAFVRRLAFVVEFPMPDLVQRAEIWRRVFPARTPVEGLDVEQLARLSLSGGNIRNVALAAAFLAAEAGEPVRTQHVLLAARGEYGKLERSVPADLARLP